MQGSKYNFVPKLLFKLGLSVNHQIEIHSPKHKFIESFKQNVDIADYNQNLSFSRIKGNKEYIGKINRNGFEIMRRNKFFDRNRFHAKAKAEFKEIEGKLSAVINISSIFGVFLIYLSIITILLISAGIYLIFQYTSFTIALGTLLIVLNIQTYMFLRRNVQVLKFDLDKFIYYLSKQV